MKSIQFTGNQALHFLTKSGNHVLRVDLQKFNGQKAYAKYSSFSVGAESSKYTLTVSGYSGTAGRSIVIVSGTYCLMCKLKVIALDSLKDNPLH
jgi:hypothetical protein